ncbi:MAG TPA: NUDIX domain-containing protein [Candidatus Limnocylindrales bacterium]|nr:NUDIX domain-containing protein [Candidatus Limnocylindrales bacterium]
MAFRPDLVECWVFRVRDEVGLEILLIRRAAERIFPGLWQCVTGGLAPDEPVPLAALREVVEETGFGPPDILGFYDLDQVAAFYDEGVDAIVTSAIFAVRVRPDADPTPSAEHDAWRWVGPAEARRLAIWPSYGESIRRIEEQLLDPAVSPWFEVTLGGERRARRPLGPGHP